MAKLKIVSVREFRDHATACLSGSSCSTCAQSDRRRGCECARRRAAAHAGNESCSLIPTSEWWSPRSSGRIQHELQCRIGVIVEQGRLTDDHAKRPHDDVLALVLDAGILTGDHDFLGCGCPTWTV